MKSEQNFVQRQISRLTDAKVALVTKTKAGYKISYGLKTVEITDSKSGEAKLYNFLATNNI